MSKALKKEVKKYNEILKKIKQEIAKVVVGQERIINALLRGIIADGHVLVEGVPGIAKTLIVRALGKVSGCEVKRIQFTVDLLPTDILGLTIYSKKLGKFIFVKGPIFANFVIADEINRAPPKTQSALLEAMQEKQVTIGRHTFQLPLPFFVMATQNPIETAGVNPLPEAQIDRFLFKIYMYYPNQAEEEKIMKHNITLKKFEEYNLRTVTSPKQIIEMQKVVKKIYISKEVEKYIVRIVRATRTKNKAIPLTKYIEYGASPRASIGLFIGSKAEALLNGSDHVTPQHVKNVAFDVLRHRIILNYAGQAEGIKTDKIIEEILNKVPVP
ncbi:MAG TPA: MoxR family ATPase [Candidatus Pacearchaeota archaeon]|nr:MoxR family ATPase [Candidatus Pacearchaeota archaeon]